MQRTNLGKCIIFFGVGLALGIWVAALQAAGVVQPPDEVRIDVLAGIYEPVVFDHALHDGYASCVECHHHVISAPPSDPVCLPCHSEGKALESVGCRDCHPVDRYAAGDAANTGGTLIYHNDTPGLIGAFHQNCISCHQVVGTGPTGCEECHRKSR